MMEPIDARAAGGVGLGGPIRRGVAALLLFGALFAGAGAALGSSGKLHYPFSFTMLTEPDRSEPESDGQKRYACGSPVRPMTDMSRLFGFYRPDSTRSVVDPETMGQYIKRIWPTIAVTRKLTGMIEAMIEDPRRRPEISRCVLRQVRAWADAGALLGKLEDNDPMGHRQAILIAIWTGAGVANGYASASPIDAEDQAAIASWFSRLIDEIIAEFTPPAQSRPKDYAWLDVNGNHRYWAAAAVALLAIHVGDRPRFAWAIDVLRSGLANAGDDGGLPLELARGRRALHYQSFALEALALLVKAADANGIVLDAGEEARLAAIAKFTAEAYADPASLAKRIGTEQEKKPQMAGWIELLLPHFERMNPTLAARLDEIAAPGRPFRNEMVALPSTAIVRAEHHP
jgi:hypothetical protein